MEEIVFYVPALKEKLLQRKLQRPRVSFCTWQPNSAFPASTHSVTHGAEKKK
ncbi:hypothetical protein EXN66_Car009147 [Channa argus]|uniref:Uncharacterized protein n=1 Tax=Channa argus TaxID=215402 RepID=A0A6G1PT02_CHAAH|nr:hypothetical protein EXN66_Car009147 [Channa argus]